MSIGKLKILSGAASFMILMIVVPSTAAEGRQSASSARPTIPSGLADGHTDPTFLDPTGWLVGRAFNALRGIPSFKDPTKGLFRPLTLLPPLGNLSPREKVSWLLAVAAKNHVHPAARFPNWPQMPDDTDLYAPSLPALRDGQGSNAEDFRQLERRLGQLRRDLSGQQGRLKRERSRLTLERESLDRKREEQRYKARDNHERLLAAEKSAKELYRQLRVLQSKRQQISGSHNGLSMELKQMQDHNDMYLGTLRQRFDRDIGSLVYEKDRTMMAERYKNVMDYFHTHGEFPLGVVPYRKEEFEKFNQNARSIRRLTDEIAKIKAREVTNSTEEEKISRKHQASLAQIRECKARQRKLEMDTEALQRANRAYTKARLNLEPLERESRVEKAYLEEAKRELERYRRQSLQSNAASQSSSSEKADSPFSTLQNPFKMPNPRLRNPFTSLK